MSRPPASQRRSQQSNRVTREVLRDFVRLGVSQRTASRLVGGAARRASPAQVRRLSCRRLAREQPGPAVRALLGEGMRELGPAGLAFESFVARLFAGLGYQTRVRVCRPGRFVAHEVDVLAETADRTWLCECKLRTKPGARIELPVVLAAYGRAADLGGLGAGPTRSLLVTNARFTADARAFADGMGLGLLGWDHPVADDLQRLVEQTGRFPVTALPHLPLQSAARLVAAGIVDTVALMERSGALEEAGVARGRVARVLGQAAAVSTRCP
jgi:hypothetical protein